MNPAPNINGRHWRAIGMLVLATSFWGLSFPIVKALGEIYKNIEPGAGPWLVTAATVGPRFVIGTCVLLAIELARALAARTRARPTLASSALSTPDSKNANLSGSSSCKAAATTAFLTRPEILQGLLIGFFATGGLIFQNDGLQFTEASTSAFLTQFAAILIPLWVAFQKRANPGTRIWLCCALVIAGVAVLGRFDWHNLYLGRGESETLLCAVFFTGQILMLDQPAFARNRPLRITLVMFIFQAVCYIIMALLVAPSPAILLAPWASSGFIVLTIILTILCTLGAFLLMNTWQPKITATEAGLIYCIEPIFGTLFALVLPGIFSALYGITYANETATWTLLLGGTLITLANILLQLRPPPKQT